MSVRRVNSVYDILILNAIAQPLPIVFGKDPKGQRVYICIARFCHIVIPDCFLVFDGEISGTKSQLLFITSEENEKASLSSKLLTAQRGSDRRHEPAKKEGFCAGLVTTVSSVFVRRAAVSGPPINASPGVAGQLTALRKNHPERSERVDCFCVRPAWA